jgi:hypothetical protein
VKNLQVGHEHGTKLLLLQGAKKQMPLTRHRMASSRGLLLRIQYNQEALDEHVPTKADPCGAEAHLIA